MTTSMATENRQLFAASRLFSPTVFREFAREGRSPVFARLVRELSFLDLSFDTSARNVFDSAFSFLKAKNYRHEYIYKSAIARKVLLGRHSLRTAALINEFRVHDCKADIVIINGTSNVYEIKSERDSLRRLEKQISAYRNVFANINVITGKKHLDAIRDIVPQTVGILLLSDRYQISTVREPIYVSTEICSMSIFDSIQISEAKKILKNLGIGIPDVPNTKIYYALKMLFKELSPQIAHEQMVKILGKTRNQSQLSPFLNRLPDSIIATALSTRISKQDHGRLLSALDTPLHIIFGWR